MLVWAGEDWLRAGGFTTRSPLGHSLIGNVVIVDSRVVARTKKARWQGHTNVERFVEQISEGHSAQRLKNTVETGILRRFLRGRRLLDVGIGTGRVSLPLLETEQLQLTGVDTSAAMIERCAADSRAAAVTLVKGDLEHLPFADGAFNTAISVDTFVHFPEWMANLDELLRVTNAAGGRIIIDIGSRDHLEAIALNRGCSVSAVQAAELRAAEGYTLRLTRADLSEYASTRNITLVAVVPFGGVLGSLVPNYWIDDSYACRSGGIDHLVSWIGADPALFAFAEFLERRVVAYLPASTTGRMYAVFERATNVDSQPEPPITAIAACDERGPEAWHAEFAAHAQHEPNRAFAVAFLLAAWPIRVPAVWRHLLPQELLRELERTERSAHIDDICNDVVAGWHSAVTSVRFHGVELSDVFGRLLGGELRERLEGKA